MCSAGIWFALEVEWIGALSEVREEQDWQQRSCKGCWTLQKMWGNGVLLCVGRYGCDMVLLSLPVRFAGLLAHAFGEAVWRADEAA